MILTGEFGSSLKGKTVLVTGGTGSMGQTFVRRALTMSPRKIIVFSRDEAKQYEMKMSPDFQGVDFRIGDMRRIEDVISALYGVEIVVNAAALKQVPSCEYFPEQAVLTNCIGMANLIRAVEDSSGPVETVVTISTDKACKPTNVMGMTKAIQERMMVAANIGDSTRYVGVRYGNVLGSRGSVIPLFQEQIRRGGPVTVTVPEMTRFLLTLDQAVDTVLAALEGARPGEIYVPKALAATVDSIARALIEDRNIKIVVTGARPGEKLHEIMVSEEEHTEERGDYYVILPMLQELRCARGPSARTAEYSSSETVLSPRETQVLLGKHGLLV